MDEKDENDKQDERASRERFSRTDFYFFAGVYGDGGSPENEYGEQCEGNGVMMNPEIEIHVHSREISVDDGIRKGICRHGDGITDRSDEKVFVFVELQQVVSQRKPRCSCKEKNLGSKKDSRCQEQRAQEQEGRRRFLHTIANQKIQARNHQK